jgi:RimJ/RimL family protein N-acetyltransferase
MLEQPRIRLVEAQEEDAERILAALEPSATQNLSFFSNQVDLERQRAYLRKQCSSEENFLYVVERVSDGAIIGTAGLHEIDRNSHNARIGLLIFRQEDRGQGYGTEAILQVLQRAFGGFALHKIYLKVFTENARSANHYTQMGFSMEGILRQEYSLNGTFKDMFRMAMLRNDWMQRYWYHHPK